VNLFLNASKQFAAEFAENTADFVESHGPGLLSGSTDEEEDGYGLQERAGQSLVDQGIGVMVAVIVIGAVAIPVAEEVINSTNVGGTTATVLGFVPLALGVGLFVAAISIVR
jgi:hypothetical protein